jgi:putative endonuclease
VVRVKDAVGRFGEQVAARQLEDAGLRILDRNWRCAEGEIDIVAADGDTLVFCEVKTRSGLAFGDPAEAVVAAKAARLRRLALRWLAAHDLGWRELRFDVVTVLRRDEGLLVRHLRGAF